MSVAQWLVLLRDGIPGYAAQPYQQLAAVYKAAGHDGDVHKILMQQRRQQIRSGTMTGRGERMWARLTGLTLGYGYQPWRALIGMLAVLILAVVMCLSAGDGLAHTNDSPTPGKACSSIERINVGLNFGVPLVNTGTQTTCGITNTSSGQHLIIAGWILHALAWAFATLFIAGFTAAVRKT